MNIYYVLVEYITPADEDPDIKVVYTSQDPLNKTESFYMLNQIEFNIRDWLHGEGITDAKEDGEATQGFVRAGHRYCPRTKPRSQGSVVGRGQKDGRAGPPEKWGQVHCQDHHRKLKRREEREPDSYQSLAFSSFTSVFWWPSLSRTRRKMTWE